MQNINLKDYEEPMRIYFQENRGKKLTQNKLCRQFKLTPSQVRYVIAEIRYKIPIANFGQRTYEFPTDKNIIRAYIKKLEGQLKEKAIKKNIAKRYV